MSAMTIGKLRFVLRAKLQRVQDGLKTLIDTCSGHSDLERCPIITALGEENLR